MHDLKFALALWFVLSVFPLSALAELEVEIRADVVYGHKDGMALTFDVITPKENAKGVGLLYMFSSGYVSEWIPPRELIGRSLSQGGRFATVLERGFTLFMVRHGSAPRYTVPEIVGDVRRATRFVRLHAKDYGIDPDRIGVFGNSAGGHLALMLGTTPDAGDPDASDPVDRVSDEVSAVVVYYPPVDFRGRAGTDAASPVLRFDAALAEAMSPVIQATPDDRPTLFIHGDKDTSVPLSQSRDMKKALDAVGVPAKLIVMEGAGHGFRGTQSRSAAKALTDWFEKYL